MTSICEKKIWQNYGLFMQNKFLFKVSSFNEKEWIQLKIKINKQSIFISMENYGFS